MDRSDALESGLMVPILRLLGGAGTSTTGPDWSGLKALLAAAARPEGSDTDLGELLAKLEPGLGIALKGFRWLDEEDDWRECVVCHAQMFGSGTTHKPHCALVAAKALCAAIPSLLADRAELARVRGDLKYWQEVAHELGHTSQTAEAKVREVEANLEHEKTISADRWGQKQELLITVASLQADIARKDAAQAFWVSQPVQVASTYRFADDWRDTPLWIAGLSVAVRTGHVTYSVSEHWPPEHNGDITTDFEAEHLVARAALNPSERKAGE
jgi:hypothetical protein